MANTLHANQVLTTTTITTTTETVLATMLPFNTLNPAGEGVVVSFDTMVTSGTGTTALVFRVRQGTTITGALVANAITVPVTAGGTLPIGFTVVDSSALALNDQNGLQYVVTVQQTGATANGTCTAATITAESATAVEA